MHRLLLGPCSNATVGTSVAVVAGALFPNPKSATSELFDSGIAGMSKERKLLVTKLVTNMR
jgi:hypothetical protein